MKRNSIMKPFQLNLDHSIRAHVNTAHRRTDRLQMWGFIDGKPYDLTFQKPDRCGKNNVISKISFCILFCYVSSSSCLPLLFYAFHTALKEP